MESPAFRRGARFAILILTSGALGASILTLAAPATAAEVTAPQMIDAFEGTFGAHAGQRRNHIKGTCAAGEFVGTSDAAALSRSALFSGKSLWSRASHSAEATPRCRMRQRRRVAWRSSSIFPVATCSTSP